MFRSADLESDGPHLVFSKPLLELFEQHGLHLFQLEPNHGLGNLQHEVAIANRDGFTMLGDEWASQMFPRVFYSLDFESFTEAQFFKNSIEKQRSAHDPLIGVLCAVHAIPLPHEFVAIPLATGAETTAIAMAG